MIPDGSINCLHFWSLIYEKDGAFCSNFKNHGLQFHTIVALGWPRMKAADSEESFPPRRVPDQAATTLYGGPPAAAVQGLHTGLGHHHLRVGEAHARLVYSYI